MKTSALNSQGEGLVYRGGMVFRRDADGTLRFESAPLATGRMTADGIQYHITDHLGSVRAVIDAATGDILEASEYTAFGERTDITSAVRQGLRQVSSFGDPSLRQHFSGKEDQAPDFSVSSTDFGARHYAPHLSRWIVPDPMGEKYYDISPYAYCANDPVNLIDPQGDTIRVQKEDQGLFKKSLEDVFGKHDNMFTFDKDGNLLFNKGDYNLSTRQIGVLNKLITIIDQEIITNVTFGDSKQIGDTMIYTRDFGGAFTALQSEQSSLSTNEIVVDPNASSIISVSAITPQYYVIPIDPNGGARFITDIVETNTTDRLFHELGHIIYDGKTQDHVIDFNNKVRRILGLKRRKYDEYHNRTY